MIDKTFKIISLAVTMTLLLASTLAQGQPTRKAHPKPRVRQAPPLRGATHRVESPSLRAQNL